MNKNALAEDLPEPAPMPEEAPGREVRTKHEFLAPEPADEPRGVPENQGVAVEVTPPTPAPPHVVAVKVSREDRLELENIAIKMQNCSLQIQIIQSDLGKALVTRDDSVKRMKAKRAELQQKYGIDIATVSIADDGTVTPLQNPINIPGM